jgi:ferredoxin
VRGGSVRPTAKDRYRQWMTHKLATWIDRFGISGCVGCGRCITWCPVAIDIMEEVRAIRETETTPGGSAGGECGVGPGTRRWFSGERELVSLPEIEIAETDKYLEVRVALSKLKSEEVEVFVEAGSRSSLNHGASQSRENEKRRPVLKTTSSGTRTFVPGRCSDRFYCRWRPTRTRQRPL